jgi:hypothetical protein
MDLKVGDICVVQINDKYADWIKTDLNGLCEVLELPVKPSNLISVVCLNTTKRRNEILHFYRDQLIFKHRPEQ